MITKKTAITFAVGLLLGFLIRSWVSRYSAERYVYSTVEHGMGRSVGGL
jgi:hypothetical protein